MAHRYFDPVREEVEKELEERRKRVGEQGERVRDRRRRKRSRRRRRRRRENQRKNGVIWEFSWMFVEKDRWVDGLRV